MGGSLPALFVVPSVLPFAMCTWLGLVVWAGGHRDWKAHRLAREAALETAALEATALEATALEATALETEAREAAALEVAPG
ncbi:MAG: hypothetical protein ABR926_12580 [Streptosporangiaceae bacterium]|jgi:hypothetical protein